ncbi:hypothetical protein [Ureaplasma canigenitalium]|uniref:hypothetical protein n=1 Tax=Ureaplasma canigenitalium TaxID=42092 RepID=UPI0012EC3CEF|nr:hypothetical protein [Ureaplasma canigenitalium]
MMTEELKKFLKRLHEKKNDKEIVGIGVKNIMNRLKDPMNMGLTTKEWNAYNGKEGYIVSIQKEALATFRIDLNNVKTWNDVDDKTKKEFENFIKKYKSKYGKNLGFWYENAKKEIVLDVVEIVKDLDEAIKKGEELNQDAIYDIKRGTAIILKN